MTTRMLYVADATLGLGWLIYTVVAGSYSPSFPWWYIFLLLGSLLLVGCTTVMRNSDKHWEKWPPVMGTGLLAAYFVPAAVVTLRRYAQGKVIASAAQLGTRLAIVTFVVVCFTVAIWDLFNARRARFSERPGDG
jgi:phosphatidylglycerophosphate synthase